MRQPLSIYNKPIHFPSQNNIFKHNHIISCNSYVLFYELLRLTFMMHRSIRVHRPQYLDIAFTKLGFQLFLELSQDLPACSRCCHQI